MMQKPYRALGLFLVMLIVVSFDLAFLPAASADEWGVDTATAPSANWLSLSAGESPWYAFQYAGDGSQVKVQLQVVPEGSAGFLVWTPELIERWALGHRVEPVGRGSDDPFAEGILTWSGSFTTAGTYYVVVKQADGQPGRSHYLLQIEGDGVFWPTSAPADTTASEATTTSAPSTAKAQPKSSPASEPEGRLVFQTTYGGPFYTISADGSNLQRITNGIDPVWSSDGEQIAFVRWEDPRGVWVLNADGSGERRVFDWHEARYPSWSPDGEQIVFSRQHRGRIEEKEKCIQIGSRLFCFTLRPDPHYNLGVVRVDNGSFREPLSSSSELSLTPDWSPDGGQIVYEDVYGLFVQSEDGKDRYQITQGNLDTSPVWSPDGSRVAFVRRQHDHWELYVVDASGSNLTRLTNTPALPDGTPGNSVAPAWSPDGNYIAFLTDRTGEWAIWVMEADGSSQRPMFDGELDGLTLNYAFNGERVISWTE
jgi:hypothetical protein